MKVFRVTGEINKPKLKTPFAKEVIVDKPEHAVEKVYAEIGSKHRVKRFHIKIMNVEDLANVAARSVAEEELNRLSVEMRYLEQTAETLQQRIGMINAAITDLSYANLTLESMEKEKENAELLVPIGGGSYIKVKLASSDTVIVGMGAGVSVEKTLPEAKAIVKERLDELERTMNSAQQQFAQVAQRINAGRSQLQSLLSKVRQGTA
jgi:prefoldin alpha subunit